MSVVSIMAMQLNQPHRRAEFIDAMREAKRLHMDLGASNVAAVSITDGGATLTGAIAYVLETPDAAALGRLRIAITRATESDSPPPLYRLGTLQNSPITLAARTTRYEIDLAAPALERPAPAVLISRLLQPVPGRDAETVEILQAHAQYVAAHGKRARAFRVITGENAGALAVTTYFADWEDLGTRIDEIVTSGETTPLIIAAGRPNPPFTQLGAFTGQEIAL